MVKTFTAQFPSPAACGLTHRDLFYHITSRPFPYAVIYGTYARSRFYKRF